MMDICDFDELMLFAKFKEKPGLYFGKPSLLSLRDQLFGMNMAFGMIYHEDAFVYLHQFIRWYHENVVKDQNGYACWWNHILYTCGGNDEMAFWSFFKHFEGYLKTIHGTALPMPKDGPPVKQNETQL